jgi:hypothetical protein
MLPENGGSRYLRKVSQDGAWYHNPEYHSLNAYHLETFKDHGLRMLGKDAEEWGRSDKRLQKVL